MKPLSITDALPVNSIWVPIATVILTIAQPLGFLWLGIIVIVALMWPLFLIIPMKWKGYIPDAAYHRLSPTIAISMGVAFVASLFFVGNFAMVWAAGLTMSVIGISQWLIATWTLRIKPRPSRLALVTGIASFAVAAIPYAATLRIDWLFVAPLFFVYGVSAYSFVRVWVTDSAVEISK